jgi:hypothetical protein
MKRIFLTAALLALAVASFAAANDSAAIMFPILDIGVGARACAMSGAFTAGADDASSVFWNPAGLSGVKITELAMTYDAWFMNSFYGHVLASVPAGPGVIGADVIYLNGGSFPDRDITGNLTDTTTQASSIGGLLSYGMNIAGGLSAGITAKVLNQSIGTSSALGIGADIGLLYEAGIIRAGINVRNIGTAGDFSMPMSVNGGIQIKPLDTQQHSLSMELDGKYLLKDAPSVMGGVEYTFSKMLSIRAGYAYRMGDDSLGGLTGLAAGVGFSLNSIKLDYAFMPYGDLGTSHKATLSYMFGSASQAAGGKKEYSAEAIKADVNITVKEAEELEKKGEIAKAAAKMRDAVLEDQENAGLWKKLGMLYYKDKKKENAVKAFERYMKLSPSDTKFADWLKKYKK